MLSEFAGMGVVIGIGAALEASVGRSVQSVEQRMDLLGRTVRRTEGNSPTTSGSTRPWAGSFADRRHIARTTRVSSERNPDRRRRSDTPACQPSDVSSEHTAIEVHPATTSMAHGILPVPEGYEKSDDKARSRRHEMVGKLKRTMRYRNDSPPIFPKTRHARRHRPHAGGRATSSPGTRCRLRTSNIGAWPNRSLDMDRAVRGLNCPRPITSITDRRTRPCCSLA